MYCNLHKAGRATKHHRAIYYYTAKIFFQNALSYLFSVEITFCITNGPKIVLVAE